MSEKPEAWVVEWSCGHSRTVTTFDEVGSIASARCPSCPQGLFARHVPLYRRAEPAPEPKDDGTIFAGERWECPDCGIGVKADEDGCCATCGADCASVLSPVAPEPGNGGVDIERLAILLHHVGVTPAKLQAAAAAQGRETLGDTWSHWKLPADHPFAVSPQSKERARSAAGHFVRLARLSNSGGVWLSAEEARWVLPLVEQACKRTNWPQAFFPALLARLRTSQMQEGQDG